MQLSLSRVQNAAACDTTIAVICRGHSTNIQYPTMLVCSNAAATEDSLPATDVFSLSEYRSRILVNKFLLHSILATSTPFVHYYYRFQPISVVTVVSLQSPLPCSSLLESQSCQLANNTRNMFCGTWYLPHSWVHWLTLSFSVHVTIVSLFTADKTAVHPRKMISRHFTAKHSN